MTTILDRRRAIQLALTALPALLSLRNESARAAVTVTRGVAAGGGLRAFDTKTRTWADWYLDGRDPYAIDSPGIGRFTQGVGTFLSDDTFEGRPIKVRGIFSSVSGTSAQ